MDEKKSYNATAAARTDGTGALDYSRPFPASFLGRTNNQRGYLDILN